MHIVTGAAGFVGSNVIRSLNARGVREILAVDDLEQGDKFLNLRDCEIADFLDKRDFREAIRRQAPELDAARALLHQGACADTTEADGRYMLDNNYAYSKELLHWALQREVPFVYASSASVYGASTTCTETPECEGPLNVYAYSKLLFDRYAKHHWPGARSTIVGLRYFNVYGPREAHKGRMASMIYQLYNQLKHTGTAKLFEGTDGYAAGEQRRDFVFVGDVVTVNLFFAEGPPTQGVFNVGTGTSRSFNEIAKLLIAQLGRGEIQYIPFPESLRGKYQSFTQSDIARLRSAGYTRPFAPLEEGIRQLCESCAEGGVKAEAGTESRPGANGNAHHDKAVVGLREERAR